MRNRSAQVRVVSARPRFGSRLAEVWRYRELLLGLVRTELKVRYKNSALGFFWSMLNPAMYLVVFYLVFQVFLKSGIPLFPIYLLSGLLVWNFFTAALAAATGSVVGNSALVKKVYFPREILPLSAIGAALVHLFLQGFVLGASLLVFRHGVAPKYLLLVPVALVALLLFLAGLSILLAAVNVYIRDAQHLLELVLLAWFWMTPIVYQFRLVSDRLGEHAWLFTLNPITPVVLTFQRAFYNQVEVVGPAGNVIPILPAGVGPSWYLMRLGFVATLGVVLLILALRLFHRLEGNFAEEL